MQRNDRAPGTAPGKEINPESTDIALAPSSMCSSSPSIHSSPQSSLTTKSSLSSEFSSEEPALGSSAIHRCTSSSSDATGVVTTGYSSCPSVSEPRPSTRSRTYPVSSGLGGSVGDRISFGWDGSNQALDEGIFLKARFELKVSFQQPPSASNPFSSSSSLVEVPPSITMNTLAELPSPHQSTSSAASTSSSSSPSPSPSLSLPSPLPKTTSSSSSRRTPSSSKWTWTILVWCHLSQILAGGLLKSLAVFLDDILAEFDSSVAFMGWMFSLEAFFFGLTCPFVSFATKRFGPRCVMMAGGLVNGCGIFVASRATNVILVGVGISVIAGVGSSMIYVAALVTVRRHFSRHYAVANGIALSGVSVAVFIFPPIIRVLIDHFGWRGALTILSAISLNSLVTGALMRNDNRKPKLKRRSSDGEGNPFLAVHNSEVAFQGLHRKGSPTMSKTCPCRFCQDRVHPLDMEGDACGHYKIVCYCPKLGTSNSCNDTLPRMCTNRAIPTKRVHIDSIIVDRMHLRPSIRQKYAMHVNENIAHCILGVTVFLWSASNTSVMKYLVAAGVQRRLTDIQGAVLLSVTGISSCVTLFGHGIIISRGWMTPLKLYLAVFILMAIGEFGLMLFKHYVGGIIASVLFGLGTGTITSLNLVVQRSVDHRAGVQAAGWLIFVEGVAGAVGGLCVGVIRDASGSYVMSFMATGVMTVTAALLVVLIITIRRMERGIPKETVPRT